MFTLDAPPDTCERGTHICDSDHRPGPHVGSDSFTRKAMAASVVELSEGAEDAKTEYPRDAVPSKKMGPVNEAEGVAVCVRVGVCEAVCDCVCEGVLVSLAVAVCVRDCVCVSDGEPVADGVSV